jgi:3-hydroxyacyl-[acyl-carrier-protein] dehydratase
MLQTLVESASWLLRLSDDFRHSIVALRAARNVKYGNFMEPGRSLVLEVEMSEPGADAAEVAFKGKGEVDGAATVSARFTLARYNLRDRNPAWQSLDEAIVQRLRSHLPVLRGDFDAPQASAS